MDLFYFLVLFSKTSQFHWKKQPFRKKFREEELDCIDIDDIRNLYDLPRLVLIDEECGNLIAVNGIGELTRNVNWKKKSDVLQYPIDVHSMTNVVGESISSVTM